MKKLFMSVVAAFLMVVTLSTAQAATSLEQQLIDFNVPANEAKIISEFVRTNNISDETINQAVNNALKILELKGDASIQELSAEVKAHIKNLLDETAKSVGLTIKLDGEKIAVFKSNGEALLSLSTVVLEELTSSATPEVLKDKLTKLGEAAIAEAGEALKDNNNNNTNTNNGSTNNATTNNATNNSTNTTTPTTPATLNKTGFNGAAMMMAGLTVMTLGAGLFVVARKINA